MPYSKISQAPENLKKLDNATLTLSQINGIARQADGLKKQKQIKAPWAVAIANFKRTHVKKKGKWVSVKPTGRKKPAPKRKGLFTDLFSTRKGYHW